MSDFLEYPDPMTVFNVLYSHAAGDGREAALFGDSIRFARPAAANSLIGKALPSFYLEFPLLGVPCFDLLTVYGEIKPGERFAPGGGYGYQPMFDWFSSLPSGHGASCGITMDTGSGETERAGIYLQQRRKTELIAPFLDSIGERGRLDSYIRVFEQIPAETAPAYIGLFPGRDGSPLRIGGYMEKSFLDAAAADPGKLALWFDRIGFTAYTKTMPDHCAELLSYAPGADYQFDIYPDGTLGDTFGLSLSFNDVKPRMAAECMEKGYGKSVMTLLERWGLADERWKKIAGAAAGRRIRVEKEDGTPVSLAMIVRFNYAKVKFKAGVPVTAKFYFLLAASELPQ